MKAGEDNPDFIVKAMTDIEQMPGLKLIVAEAQRELDLLQSRINDVTQSDEATRDAKFERHGRLEADASRILKKLKDRAMKRRKDYN